MQFRHWLVENTGLTPQHFWDLADEQRGEPESAMLRVQFALGGGTLNVAVENAGDILHRMSERPTFATAGYEFVKPKVGKLLAWMDKPYRLFNDEVRRNMLSNAEYRKEKDGLPLTDYYKMVDDSLKAYADAHRKLTPYNHAQKVANQIAIAVGEKRFHDAVGFLKELEKHLVNKEEWIRFAHDGLSEEHKVAGGRIGHIEPSKQQPPYDSSKGF